MRDTERGGALPAESLVARLRKLGNAVVGGGHAFASGRYPITTRKFATPPANAVSALDDVENKDGEQ